MHVRSPARMSAILLSSPTVQNEKQHLASPMPVPCYLSATLPHPQLLTFNNGNVVILTYIIEEFSSRLRLGGEFLAHFAVAFLRDGAGSPNQ